MRLVLATVLCAAMFALAGCGGDNLELCDGCGTRTATPTPTSTNATPTATSATPASPTRTPDAGLAGAHTPGPQRVS
jgi:hypothetical protein